MPFVFVHGVSNRPGPAWDRACASRAALLKRFAFPRLKLDPNAVEIAQPMWGEHGANPAWNNASLPSGKIEALGLDDEDPPAVKALLDASLIPLEGVKPDSHLTESIRRAMTEDRSVDDRQPLEDFVDALWDLGSTEAEGDELEALATFAAAAVDYAQSNPKPAWVSGVTGDAALANTLIHEVEQWTKLQGSGDDARDVEPEEFGGRAVFDRVRESTQRLSHVGQRISGRALVGLTRDGAHQATTRFLGDVFVYLNERGPKVSPGPIITIVGGAIADAQGRATATDPLIVVAHSMGGEIVYDLVTHYHPDLEIATLVTVGSQVAYFEELKQFKESDQKVPADPATDRVSAPTAVKRWINIFDRNDLLGFAAEGVFNGVKDFAYSTGQGVIAAHGAYFNSPSFHSRLAKRLVS